MSWIIPSISIMICSTIILIIIYFYLFYLERKVFIGLWTVSWSVYLIAQVITLISISEGTSSFLAIVSSIVFLISAILLIWGTYSFFNKSMPIWCAVIFAISLIWLIISSLLKKSFIITNFPVAIVLGMSTIWVGVMFLYYGEGQKYLRRILGGCFILWGLHKMDYTVLRNVSWFAPWGYIISAGFSLLITIAFIFIYFQKTSNELIAAQQTLLSSEKRMRTIIENQVDIIFELDSEGSIVFISPACINMIGWNPEDIKGKSFRTFIGDDVWFLLIQSKQEGINFEKTWSKRDKSTLHVNIYCKPSFNLDGNLERVFGSVHDITQNKLLDEARDYDKLKTEFFANISHELKTPLNVILASAQLLELYNKSGSETSLAEKVDKTVITIRQNIFRLLRLINNLIDITKVDTGFFELNLKNYNIVDVIEETTMSVVDYVKSRDISIEFDTDIEEKVIAVDAEKIERVILNLLSNAVKFTNPGGNIVVMVSDGEEFITVSIKDTGIGIPKDKQQIIFERFRQVDKSLSRNNEGSGIGLSLVKSLVELHGGSVKLESTYGEGSKFIIELPVTRLPDDSTDKSFEMLSVRKTDIEFSDIYQ